MTWSAAQYSQFEAQRTRPVRDLLAAVPDCVARKVIDLGCGPGNSTEVLQGRFPDADVRGIDTSPEMLAAARKRLPGVAFDRLDIARWLDEPGQMDVILANAVLQWLPHHSALMPALVAKLAIGGSLAVQMPDNLDEPAHELMREIAADGPWAGRLETADVRPAMHAPRAYFEWLTGTGATVDVWRTTYLHALPGARAVVEWFKGSGLRPFIEPLDAPMQAEFLARYEAALAAAYPALPNGTVLLPFPRVFFVAMRR